MRNQAQDIVEGFGSFMIASLRTAIMKEPKPSTMSWA